jgi:hypothetical protein
LKRIKTYAFSRSGLKSIRIPKSVEFIGRECFYECKSLIEVIFEGEPNIESEAFGFCSVRTVKIPAALKLNYSFPDDSRIEFLAPGE